MYCTVANSTTVTIGQQSNVSALDLIKTVDTEIEVPYSVYAYKPYLGSLAL